MTENNVSRVAPVRISDNSVPVLVLVSSQHGGVGIIRSLGRAGVTVYGVHQNSWEPASCSRYLRKVFYWDFPHSADADSLAFLQAIAKQVKPKPVLLPTSDRTASFLAENSGSLAPDFLFSAPPREVVRNFSSKKHTFDLCRQLGIPTPRITSLQHRSEILEFTQTCGFPVIVKGDFGDFRHKKVSRSRVAIVADKNELMDIFDLNATDPDCSLIVQEYIPGGDDSVWMFNGYFNEHSECLFAATGQKLRQFPPRRGSTSLGICARNAAVENQTISLMKAVKYRGPLDVGYRFDARDGQYKLLDVNPRIGSTFRLFAAQDQLDVALALYLDVTKQTVPRAQPCDGRKWMVETNDLLSSWTYVRERELSILGWIRSMRGVQEGVWLDPGDLRPLAVLPFFWLRKYFRRRMD